MAKQQKSKKGNAHARNIGRTLHKYGRSSGERNDPKRPAKAGKRKIYGAQERWDGRLVRQRGK